MSNEIPIQPKSGQIQFQSRRHFLKWGVIGGLVALPIGFIAHRRWKGMGYEYIVHGPFRFEDADYSCVLIDGTRWSGSTRNKLYTPQYAEMRFDWEEENPSVCFTFSCNVAKDAPTGLFAKVSIAAISNGKVYTSEGTYWRVPHKQPPRLVGVYYEGEAQRLSYWLPEEIIRTSIPFEALSKIDSIKLRIQEFVRS